MNEVGGNIWGIGLQVDNNIDNVKVSILLQERSVEENSYKGNLDV